MIKELPKHNYRRIMRLLLTAVLTFCMLLMPGCQKQAETKLEEIQDRGVLLVGTAGDYQPLSYLDTETSSLSVSTRNLLRILPAAWAST